MPQDTSITEKYDIIIGLEIHAELKTKSKMFCSCDNDSEGKAPNTVVCPICMGHPGALPSANKEAIAQTILVGLALEGKINRLSKFDRKHYFYPDLPKNYQISQYDLPLVYDASLQANGVKIKITRVHLEEDTGKLTHPSGRGYSLVDYNRGGTPLIEMVTEPVIKDALTAKKFCQRYQQILRYLNVSNADMEKGQMRCEANISVQEKNKWEYLEGKGILPLGNYQLNPKIEVKNINSFKAVEKAIDYEIKRQITALQEGEELYQETRGWNENKGETVRQRVKETSADYRYFPEPDIPPLKIEDDWIKEIADRLIELPHKKKERFMEQYFLPEEMAEILVGDKHLADYAEQVFSELFAWIVANGDEYSRQNHKLSKAASNWLIGELFKHLNENNQTIKDIKITPENFAEFIALVYTGKINSSAAQIILQTMYEKGGDPTDIMQNLKLEQLDDETELEMTAKKILQENHVQAQEYKNGKKNLMQFFVGKIMAATGGKANPKILIKILTNLLNNN